MDVPLMICRPLFAGGMGEVEPLGRRLSRPAKSRAARGIWGRKTFLKR